MFLKNTKKFGILCMFVRVMRIYLLVFGKKVRVMLWETSVIPPLRRKINLLT